MLPATYEGKPLIYQERLHPKANPSSHPGKMMIFVCPGCASHKATPRVFAAGEFPETCARCQGLIWPDGVQYALLPKPTHTLWTRVPRPPPALSTLLPKASEAARMQTPFPLPVWTELLGRLAEAAAERPEDDWITVLSWEALRGRRWLTPPRVVTVPIVGSYAHRPVVPLAPQRILAHSFLSLGDKNGESG